MNGLEQMIERSSVEGGYREDFCPGLGGWRDKSGLTLTATSEPDIITISTASSGTLLGLKWDHGGGASDFATFSFTMPYQWAEIQDDMQLVVAARKVDATADENADLCLQAGINWFQPDTLNVPNQQTPTATVPTVLTAGDSGSVVNGLGTPARALLAACNTAASNATVTGFATYVLDIGRRLKAESLRIEAGSVCTISFGPHEAVGATDMDLETSLPIIRWRRHAGLYVSGAPGRNRRHD